LKSVDELSRYSQITTVQDNIFILNCPPNSEGLICDADVKYLMALRKKNDAKKSYKLVSNKHKHMNKRFISMLALIFLSLSLVAQTLILPDKSTQTSELFPKLGKKVDLFIWAGQSNAQGWKGDATYYPTDVKSQDESIGLYYTFYGTSSSDGNWITMQKQKGRFPNGHFGPEVSFSRALKSAKYNPVIFKYALGSTSIYNNWKTPGKGGMYDKMIVELKKAIVQLESKGFKVTVRGLIWIQGESDAENDTYANAYYFSLLSIINDLRMNVVKNKKLPIILGVDEQHQWVVERPIIVESQKRIMNENKNIMFTSMIGLPKADATHLTPEGLVTHGNQIFDAYKSVVKHKCLFKITDKNQGSGK
jgi:hypothetical protein